VRRQASSTQAPILLAISGVGTGKAVLALYPEAY
jgi:hypothetical protein